MAPPATRRRFLQQSAFALAAACTGARTEGKTIMLPILDTHQHLWDLNRFRINWIQKDAPLNRNFTIDDYRLATAGLNVVKAIYMEVDLDPVQQTAEAEWISEVCRRGNTPTVAAVISGRPASENFKNYLQPFKGNKYIKGVRQVLHVPATPAGYCLDPKFIQGIRLLGDLGLSFDLCFRQAELSDAVKLIDACPDTCFILDHCGNALVPDKDRTVWKKGMAAIAERPRVMCKVSGIVASAKPGAWTVDDLAPIVNDTVEAFGKERVMFGGDWPVCLHGATYRQWVEALKTIVQAWSEEDQRKLFHDNAARYYGLS